MKKRRWRSSYKFTEKTHSKKGIAASVLSGLLLIWFGVFVGISYRMEGNLPVYFGCAGVFALILTLIACGIALSSLKEEDSFMGFPRLGMVMSLLDLVCWGGSYIWGFCMM